jgi:hypothetical protein
VIIHRPVAAVGVEFIASPSFEDPMSTAAPQRMSSVIPCFFIIPLKL